MQKFEIALSHFDEHIAPGSVDLSVNLECNEVVWGLLILVKI